MTATRGGALTGFLVVMAVSAVAFSLRDASHIEAWIIPVLVATGIAFGVGAILAAVQPLRPLGVGLIGGSVLAVAIHFAGLVVLSLAIGS